MNIVFPELSLVVLIGPSGAGKTTFARRHFKPTEILNSDFFRGLVSDDENDQTVSAEAFESLHFIAAKRLANGRLTVIDATNVQPAARKPLVDLARNYHFFLVAIVLDLPEEICWNRNQARPDRTFGRHVIRGHRQQLRRSLKQLKREGFRYIYRFTTPEEVDTITIQRQPLWNNRRYEHGPFDIIGDIHGCCDELEILLEKLGYELANDGPDSIPAYRHPEGRKAIFLGDLVDRGPRSLDTVHFVRQMVRAGFALCVPGNHDMKLVRKLDGRNVQISHGLATTLAEIDELPASSRQDTVEELKRFFKSLISHYVLDDGKLVVAHAGMKEAMQGRGSGKVRSFALYGETTGETDEYGLPIRHNWAGEYRGRAMVVYGHTAIPTPEWLNNTINIDTGCVFGGKLTALRYPEKEIVSVPALQVYAEPGKPFLPETDGEVRLTAQQRQDELLRLEDVIGKRVISTPLRKNITIREENAIAALEAMSRFAANPKWLIYLPPTMSPSETSQQAGLLEHPTAAFDYYRSRGILRVVCEQKHMGSRAVVIVCRDEAAAQRRFGVIGEGIGICLTRTGRRFFRDGAQEMAFLDRIRDAAEAAGWWDQFETEWVCLDSELMPWSAKAQELLRNQYAAVGAAARASLAEAVPLLEKAAERSDDALPFLARYRARQANTERYAAAYGHYCWPVESLNDLKLAPFHLLATEGKVHTDRDHLWHMETLKTLCQADEGLLLATPYQVVDLTDQDECAAAVNWWKSLTAAGGEGIVVKPVQFIPKGSRGLLQPAIKVRGVEYLRIIYGPDYTAPEHLERLRSRGLSRKRSLALREFTLGLEALERFVQHEPLRRVHECVFGVLALESEPVDPRL